MKSETQPSSAPLVENTQDVTPAIERLSSPTIPAASILPPKKSTTGKKLPTRKAIPRPPPKTRLWYEEDSISMTQSRVRSLPADVHCTRHRTQPSRSKSHQKTKGAPDPSDMDFVWQAETGPITQKQLVTEVKGSISQEQSVSEVKGPISQEQLVAELKGSDAGLARVEFKCIQVDASHSTANRTSPKRNNTVWQGLTALHHTLLYKNHDSFLASHHPSASPAPRTLHRTLLHRPSQSFLMLQHPSASPALRRLASKSTMPARTWCHITHLFLEFLRHRLPSSLEHMFTCIYFAYSMMALPYGTASDERNRLPSSLDHILTHIYLAYSTMALLYETASDERVFSYEGALGLDPKPTDLQQSQRTVMMKFPQTEHPLAVDCSLRSLLWTDKFYPDDFSKSDKFGKDEKRFEYPSLMKGSRGRASWCGYGDGYSRSREFCSDPFDDLRIKGHSDCRNVPRFLLSPFYFLFIIPQKYLGLAVLTAIAIPVVSAELPGRDLVTT